MFARANGIEFSLDIRTLLILTAFVVLGFTSVGYGQPTFDNTWYVDASATGADDGSSWTDAFVDLQDALAAADVSSGDDEIWAAAGTYYPGASGNQTATFDLLDNVSLYGGFLGNAPGGGETSRNQRDPEANETILSGDIDGDGDPGGNADHDNSLHVVTADGVDNSAVLNGFTVYGGYADGAATDADGGGILVLDASPIIVHCNVDDNWADEGGGGIFVKVTGSAAPVVFNCSFFLNLAVDGSGMRLEGTGTALTLVANCLFSYQFGPGGAIAPDGPDVDIVNCTFYFNDYFGCPKGQFHVTNGSEVTITNSIIWAPTHGPHFVVDTATGSSVTVSYSDVEGGLFVTDTGLGCPPVVGVTDGGGNIDKDPKFCEGGVAPQNFRLLDTSPCIDRGSDAAVPADLADVDDDGNMTETVPWDRDSALPLTHHGRFFDVINGPGSNTNVDMGAYENQHICACPWDIASAGGGLPPDGKVGISDYLKLLSDSGNCPGCAADFNCDLVVDGTDQSELFAHWGSCPGFCVPGP